MNEEQLKAQLQATASQMEADGISHDEIQSFIDGKKDEWKAKYRPEEEAVEEEEVVEKPVEPVAEDAPAVPESTELASDDSSLESPTEVGEAPVQEDDQYDSQISASLINDFEKGVSKRENQDAYNKYHETGEFDATLLGPETQARIDVAKEDHAKLQKIRDEEGEDAYLAALKEKQTTEALGDGIFNNQLFRAFNNRFGSDRLSGASGGYENLAVKAAERIRNLESVKDSWEPEVWEREMEKALSVKSSNDFLSYEKFMDAEEFQQASSHGNKELDLIDEKGDKDWGKIWGAFKDGTLIDEFVTQLPNTVISALGTNAITQIPGALYFSAQMASEYRSKYINEGLNKQFGQGKWGQKEYTKFIHENRSELTEAKLYGMAAGQLDRFVDRISTRGVGKVAGAFIPKAGKEAIKKVATPILSRMTNSVVGKFAQSSTLKLAGGFTAETLAEQETEQWQEEIGDALVGKKETGENPVSRAWDRWTNWHWGGRNLYSEDEIKSYGNLRAITFGTAGISGSAGSAARHGRGTVKEVYGVGKKGVQATARALGITNIGRKVNGKQMTREEEMNMRPEGSVEANKVDGQEAQELANALEQTEDVETQETLKKGIVGKINSIEKRNLNNKDMISRMSDKTINDIQTNQKELGKWKKVLKNEQLSPATLEVAQTKINEINEKIDFEYNKPLVRAEIKKKVDAEQVDEKRRLSDVQSKINELSRTPESAEKYKDLKKKEKDYKDELDKGDLTYQVMDNDPQTEIDNARKLRETEYVKDPSLSVKESKAAKKRFKGEKREEANLKLSSLIQDDSISGVIRSEAVVEFIENNQAIIHEISNKYSGRARGTSFGSAITRADVDSKTHAEMLKKVKSFDPKSGVKFGTWLLSGLKKKVGNYVTNQSGAVKTSRQKKGKAKPRIATTRLVEDSQGFSAEEALDTGYYEDEDYGSYTGASAGGGIVSEEGDYLNEVNYTSRDVEEDFDTEDLGEFDEDINATKEEKTADDYLRESEYDDDYENDRLGDEEFEEELNPEDALEDSYNSERRETKSEPKIEPKKKKRRKKRGSRSNYVREGYSAEIAEAIKDFYSLDDNTINNVKNSIKEGLANDSFPDVRQGNKNISSEVAKQTGGPIVKAIDKLLGKKQADKVKYLSENTDKMYNLLPEWAQGGQVFSGIFLDGNPAPEVWENYFGTGSKDGARKLKKFRNALVERVTDTLLDETLENNPDLSLIHAEVGMDATAYSVYRKERDPDLIKAMGDRLKAMWPGVRVIEDQVEVEAFFKANNVPSNIGGMYDGETGTIILNHKIMGNDTVLHEFAHMWMRGIAKSNPELWEQGAKLVKQHPAYDETVRLYSKYKQYRDNPNLMLEEAMVQLIGLTGTAVFKDKTKANAWDKYVTKVKNIIQRLFGKKDGKTIADMTIKEFVNHAAVEIISGKSLEGAILGNDPMFQGTWVEEGQARAAQVYQQRAGIDEAMKNPEVLEKLGPIIDLTEQNLLKSKAMMDALNGAIDLPSGDIKPKTKSGLVNPVKTLTDWFKVLTVVKPEHKMLIVDSLIYSTRPKPASAINAHLGVLFTQKPILKQAVIDAGIDMPGVAEMIDSLEEIKVGKHTVVAGGDKGQVTKIMRSIVDWTNNGKKVVEPAGSRNKLKGPSALRSLRKTGGKANEAAGIVESNKNATVQRDILRTLVDDMVSLVKDGSIDESSMRRLAWGISRDQRSIVRSAVKMEYYHRDSDSNKSTVEHVIPASAFIGELIDEAIGHNRPEVKQAILDNYVGVNLDDPNDKMLATGEIGLLQNTVAAYDPASNIFKTIPDAYARYMNDKVFINPFDLISYEDPNVSLATKMGLDPSLEADFKIAVQNVDNASVLYKVVNENPGAEAGLLGAIEDADDKRELLKDRLKYLKKIVNDPQVYKTNSAFKKSKIDPNARKNLQGIKALLATAEGLNTKDVNSLIAEAKNIIENGKKTQKQILQENIKKEDKIRESSKEVTYGDPKLGKLDKNQALALGKKRESFWNRIKRLDFVSARNKDLYTLNYDLVSRDENKRQDSIKWFDENIYNPLNDANQKFDDISINYSESVDKLLEDHDNNGGIKLNEQSGIKVGEIELDNFRVVEILNHLKDTSLWKKMANAGINNEIIQQIVDHVDANPELRVLANGKLDIYANSRTGIDSDLEAQGLKSIGDTRIDTSNLSENDNNLLAAVYGTKEDIPYFAPYSPTSTTSDQEINFDEMFESKGKDPFTMMSGNLRSRTEGGTYVIPNEDQTPKIFTYGSKGGPIHSATYLGFAKNISAFLNNENRNKFLALRGKPWMESMDHAVKSVLAGGTYGKKDELTASAIKFLNRSIGNVMWFNTRSMMLQGTSTFNFAVDDKRVWKTWATESVKGFQSEEWKEAANLIWNSSWRKLRMKGGTQIETSELFQKDGTYTAFIDSVLQKGYSLTKMGDIGAIMAGGTPWVMNRINDLVASGMEREAAKAQALKDFAYRTSDKSQQSTRPERLGKEQTSILGRLFLAFGTTQQQYSRISSRALNDIKYGTPQEKAKAVREILYYQILQSVMFNTLQQSIGYGVKLFKGETDDEENEKEFMRISNATLNQALKGSGARGAILGSVKDALINRYYHYKKTGKITGNEGKFLLDLANSMPAVGNKARQATTSLRDYHYDTSAYGANEWVHRGANLTAAATGVPLDRLLKKTEAVGDIFADDLENWQKTARLGGWTRYSLDANLKKKGSDGFDTRFGNKFNNEFTK